MCFFSWAIEKKPHSHLKIRSLLKVLNLCWLLAGILLLKSTSETTLGKSVCIWSLISFLCLCYYLSQNNASKLLLAIMESRHDSENAERILYNMRPKELVCVSSYKSWHAAKRTFWQCGFLQVEVIKKAYMQGEIEVKEPEEDEDEEEEHSASPRNVGHNIYILAHQVSLVLFKGYCGNKFQ